MSKRALLIKLTSMGDLVHALPALTDAARAIPGIQFDWVVDEAFADVPSWHPAVKNIIPSAHRRWKKNLRQSIFSGELRKFYQNLNADDYDLILDTQNNIKSAAITWLRRGSSHGLDKNSVRERPAHWAYNTHHPADKSLHAVQKQRQLFSQALGYPLPDTPPDYGIDRQRMPTPAIRLEEKFLIFVHNASWSTKLWPEQHWHSVIEMAANDGFQVLLPCGNEEEQQRSMRLADGHNNALALPKLKLTEVAGLMLKASGAISCDTGLCHMAGMLGLPTVSFYGPTNYQRIGAVGDNQAHLIADGSQFPCAPCYRRQCNFNGNEQDMSVCMKNFDAATTWQTLSSLIRQAS